MLTGQQQEQFTILWTEAQPVVSQYVMSLVTYASTTQDVVQNTSLALLRKFNEYDPARPFLPWALGIAKFEILSYRRDLARSQVFCDSDFLDRYTATWAAVAPHLENEASVMTRCVENLPDRQRKIIRMTYSENLSSDEIAPRLGLTSANVRAILSRTRNALRGCVQRRLSAGKGAT